MKTNRAVWWQVIAILSVLLSALLNWAYMPLLGINLSAIYIISVIVCARGGGNGPALTVVILSTIIDITVLASHVGQPLQLAGVISQIILFDCIELFTIYMVMTVNNTNIQLRKLVLAIEHSPTSVIITDIQGKIEYVNPKFTEATGYTAAEVIGKNPSILKSGETSAAQYAELLRTIQAGGEWRGELHNRRKNGTMFWELVSISPVYDEHHNIINFIAVKEDITAQKAHDVALRESEQRFRLLTEASPHIVWTSLPDGNVDYVNHRWIDYTGISMTEIAKGGWTKAIHPDDYDMVMAAWQHSLMTGIAYRLEYRFRGQDGQYRWFLLESLPLRDSEEHILKWYGTCIDVDDQKLVAIAMAEATKAKDHFMAVLSHELRTPLTPVLMGVSAMLEQCEAGSLPDCGQYAATLTMVRDNIQLEARLIDDLLDVSRIVRGKLEFRFSIVDMHRIIKRTIEICHAGIAARDHKIDIDLQAKKHYVRGDQDRLQQVIWNLLSNAVKYTPLGGTIQVSTADHDDKLRIVIKDNGIGIDRVAIPKLFEAFERAENSSIIRATGLGLGLTITKYIVEAHGGTIIGDSEGPNHGSTFTVVLQTVKQNAEPLTLPQITRTNNHILRIFLVEDNAATVQVIADILHSKGHEVTVAKSFRQAMKLAHGAYDIVISDIDLGDGTGLDLMREIRTQSMVPGIALSGYATGDDVRESIEVGFNLHLAKPITFSVLENAIHSILQVNKALAG